MGLDDLVRCIELLKERMASHHDALRENEWRTRMALIDPLLRTLGWDVSDPDVVAPEYKVRKKLADYALLRPDGQPATIVEAKRLDAKLGDDEQVQMLNYAFMDNITYAALTDGNHWELYDLWYQGAWEERRILKVSIADGPAHENALKLLLLWRPNLASGSPVPAKPPILGPNPPPPPPPPPPGDWIDLFKYNPPPKSPCPASIRFWDGSEQLLKRWYEILTSIVEKLYAEKWLTVADTPIGWSNSSYSVHTEPVHPTGKQFADHKKIDGTPLFVNVNLNAGQTRNNARNLLERFGPQSAKVYLRLSGQ